METPPTSSTMVDLSGDTNIFPNTDIALATLALADLGEWAGDRPPAVAMESGADADRAQHRPIDARHQR